MSEAAAILQRYAARVKQLHVSEVNSQSKHDPLSFESVLAFQKVSHLVPENVPVTLAVAFFSWREDLGSLRV